MTIAKRRAALWIRVSTPDQILETQADLLTEWANRRDVEIVKVYRVERSAWRGDHHPMLRNLYADASHGDFDVVMVQALDRLGREGPGATLQVWKTLLDYGVKVLSFREPFIESLQQVGGPAFAELMVMFAGWIAQQESELISQRTKAGNRRRKAEGKPVGRQPGAKDRSHRRTEGYKGNRNAAKS